MWTVRGTIRGDPQETLCRIRSPILFVRSFILSRCNNNEAEMSIWVMGPSSGKEQQCGGDPKLSRHRVVDTHTCVQRAHKGMGQRTGRSIRDQRCKELTPLLDGFSTLEAFLGLKAQLYSHHTIQLSVDVLSLILCSDRNLIWQLL